MSANAVLHRLFGQALIVLNKNSLLVLNMTIQESICYENARLIVCQLVADVIGVDIDRQTTNADRHIRPV